MAHRTDLSQADEALRRAQDNTSEIARCMLRAIAQRLRDERPTDPMRDSIRISLALTYSERRLGRDTARARIAEREFLSLAPRVVDPITRGEYALILDRIAARA